MITFYTSFTQDHSVLNEQENYFDDCRYVCFTDQNFDAPEPWEVKVVHNHTLTKNQLTRLPKINSCDYFQEGDITIYCDSHFNMFLSTVKYLLDVFIANDYDWMMQSHDTRKTISDELSFYYANGFYSEENIKNTIQKLKKQKYDFSSYQNVYCGFMIRRVNEKVKKFEHEWWEKYMNTDSIINRDQFPFSILASNSDINLCITKDVNVWNFDKSSPKQLDVTASIKDYNRPNIDEIAKMQEYIVKETKIPIVGGFHFR